MIYSPFPTYTKNLIKITHHWKVDDYRLPHMYPVGLKVRRGNPDLCCTSAVSICNCPGRLKGVKLDLPDTTYQQIKINKLKKRRISHVMFSFSFDELFKKNLIRISGLFFFFANIEQSTTRQRHDIHT